MRLKSSKCADSQRLQSLLDKHSGPSRRCCVWVPLSGWASPVLIFLELGVSPPQLLAGLSLPPMLNVTFAGDSVAWEHPQRQWGSVLSSPKTQPLWAQGGGGGEACGLSSIPHWGVADTGHTMAQLVPATLGHLRTPGKEHCFQV